MLQENVSAIKRVDKRIENDLEEHFQVWIPMSSNIVKYKEGIHFPVISELLKLVKDNEDLKHDMKLKKMKYIEDARRNNHNDYSDDYDDEADNNNNQQSSQL